MTYKKLLEMYLNETRPGPDEMGCLTTLSNVVVKPNKHIFREFLLWAYEQGYMKGYYES